MKKQNSKILGERCRRAKQFIFDLDGTLVDSDPLNWQVYRQVILEYSGEKLSFEGFKNICLGSTTAGAFTGYFQNQGISDFNLHRLISRFLSLKASFLDEDLNRYVKLKPGTKELLTILTERNRSIALATATERSITEKILSHYGIRKNFDLILTAEDVLRGKPDPEIYLKALSLAGHSPQEAIVFEDSPNGITSALEAGIFCVALEIEGFNDEAVIKAHEVITDFKTIAACFS